MKKKTLKSDLVEIKRCYNTAKSRLAFSRESRNRKSILKIFGLKSESEDKFTSQDLEILKEHLEIIIRDKYSSQRFIEDKKIEIYIPTLETSEDYRILALNRDKSPEPDSFISIFNPKFSDQIVTLLQQKDGCNQLRPAQELFDNIFYRQIRGQLLLAQTGAGKTYILGSVIKNLLANNILLNCFSPWPIIYVTKASVVEQTKKVLGEEFNIDCVNTVHVINIEMLRSELGSLFVKEEIEIINGSENVIYKWKRQMVPRLIVWDECQILAREQSIQSKIAQDINRVEIRYPGVVVFQIFSSATPFARVFESRCFACSTRTHFDLGLGSVTLDDSNWRQFSTQIAAPSDPLDYCEAAIKRLVDKLEPFIVRVKNVRPKHKGINKCQRIHFATKEEREEYNKAWEEYQKKKGEIEGDESLSDSQSRFALLAQFTIFRKAAEKIRRHHLAKFAIESWNAGKAPVLACAFKGTITAVYRLLIEEHGWTRNDISLIWGGATESLSLKKKIAKRVKTSEALQEALKESGLDINELLGFDIEAMEEKSIEDIAFERLHRLSSQKPEEREEERVRFQKQKSKLMIFTFKSGGVGLSCHHQYSFSRQREALFTPVYSEKELVQALGRCPRITSLSDTFQSMVFYSGTIEEHVATRVILKLKCLRNVVKSRESWESLITGKQLVEDKTEEDESGTNEFQEYGGEQ